MTTDALLSARFRHPPWAHQAREFEISAELPARALIWQMRTGKTKLIIDTACHLYEAGKIDCVLIFAPNGVHRNWIEREIPAHLWAGVEVNCVVWDTRIAGEKQREPRKRLGAFLYWWENATAAIKSDRLAVFAFNNEIIQRDDVFRLLKQLVMKRKCLGVWDESSDYRTPGAKRTRRMRAFVHYIPYRRILDGTPITNSPLHAFSQFELLEKGALGFESFTDFKMHFATWRPAPHGRGMRITGFQNLDDLKNRMAQYSSVVLRSDCPDLPALEYRTRAVPLTDQQKALYEAARTKALLAAGDFRADIGTQIMRLLKLQQIVSGFVIDQEGVVQTIPGATGRLDVLIDELELTPGKCIVWCQFQEDIRRVTARLALEKIPFVEYHGKCSTSTKQASLARFTPTAALKCLVGQPQAGGRGLELSAADKIIHYSHTFSALTREQANERATKMSGNNVCIVDLIAPGVDAYIRSKVMQKISIADDIAGRGMQAVLEEMKL